MKMIKNQGNCFITVYFLKIFNNKHSFFKNTTQNLKIERELPYSKAFSSTC